jgi:hypothetical protein
MFEHIKQAQEREASKESQHLINSMKNSDYLAISHHLSSLIVAIAAFCMTIIAVSTLSNSNHNPIIGYGLLVFAVFLVLFHEVNKRKPNYLNKIALLILRVKSFCIRHWYSDYLAKYFWVSCIFLFTILLVLTLKYILGSSGWVLPKVYQSEIYSSSVNMVITTASGLLAAQIALFSFMMQQVLSKYSGVMAQTVASHRVFKLLALFPVLGLLVPFILHNFGAPNSLETTILPVIGFMLLAGLLFTVTVAKSGLSESLAVRYFGVASSKKIIKAIPAPYKSKSKYIKYWWRALYFVGLDFRNKERFQVINSPVNGTEVTMESLNAALGVANKAAVEGQHDVFVSSLISIEVIMVSYSKRRSLYISSEDEVFTYLNYQFAALIESTAKIPNQYLISNLTNSIGKIAKLTYCVGKIPKEIADAHRHRSSNNLVTTLWVSLLVQCFEHTHTLTRSTAAHTSLRQISEVVGTSIINDDSDLITITYLPSIRKVFAICIVRIAHAYHKDLAGQCIVNLMWTLTNVTAHRDSLRGTHQDPFEETLNCITELSNLYLAVDSAGSINLNDPLNIILSKTADNQICIQEIFFMIANRDMKNIHSYRVAISDMEKVVDEIASMGSFAVNANVYTSAYYLEALFEILYLVIRGLPNAFNEFDQQEEQQRASFRLPEQFISSEQRLIERICSKLNELVIIFYQSERMTTDWQQSVYSSIGILVLRFTDHQEEFVRRNILEIIQNLYTRIRSDTEAGNRTAYDCEKYLQLAAAWLNYFEINNELVEEIKSFLTNNRGYCRGYGGSRERYGLFGYPTLQHDDFYLYSLVNIRHPQIMSEEHWQNFQSLGNRLISDEILIPFANNIREMSEDNV